LETLFVAYRLQWVQLYFTFGGAGAWGKTLGERRSEICRMSFTTLVRRSTSCSFNSLKKAVDNIPTVTCLCLPLLTVTVELSFLVHSKRLLRFVSRLVSVRQ